MHSATLSFIRAVVGLGSFAVVTRVLVGFFAWRGRFARRFVCDPSPTDVTTDVERAV